MDDNALVSVIIPVYNGLPFLNEALDSVVKQTYKNLEIIVIDDGSTDGSGDLCDEYAAKDGRLRVIHQENKGLSAARNVGLEIMTGSAVAFLDADDAYQPNYIESLHSALNINQADMAICRFALYRTNLKLGITNPEQIKPRILPGQYDRTSVLNALIDGELNSGVWNKLYGKELWNEIRFPVGHVYEEIDTVFRILDLCSKVCVIDDLLYLYRKHNGSITDTISPKNTDDWLLACSHIERYVEERIPVLFTEKQLNTMKQSRLRNMIHFYSALTVSEGEKEYRQSLRKRIVSDGIKIGIRKCGAQIVICYWLIRYCPWILRLIYPAIRGMRRATQ